MFGGLEREMGWRDEGMEGDGGWHREWDGMGTGMRMGMGKEKLWR